MQKIKDNAFALHRIDDARDWIKFALGEYFRWYAAFLALNIAALALANDAKWQTLIAFAFIFIDILGAVLAAYVLYWASDIRLLLDENWRIARKSVQNSEDMSKERDISAYPFLPIKIALYACMATQAIFSMIWLYLLIFGNADYLVLKLD